MAVDLQVTRVIVKTRRYRLPLLSARPAVTPATLRGLLPILLLGEQRHDVREQFAYDCYPTAGGCDFNPGPSAPESSTLTTQLPILLLN